MAELIFFLFFGLTAISAALSLILQRNIIYSALSLIVVIASLAGLFLLLHAQFLAVLQIIIYAGAIMALFLFVIMIVDVPSELPSWGKQSRLALLVLLLIAGAAIWVVSSSSMVFEPLSRNLQLNQLARELFTIYVLPFEAISILIVSAVIGALYIARREQA